MPTSVRNKLVAVAAIGAAALGGSVVANAATSSTNSASSSTAAAATNQAAPAQRDPSLGGHVGSNGATEKLLTGDTASKVEAAAKAKLPGATILRVENDADTGSAYEAHVTKADGTEAVVYVDSGFNVTSVGTMGHR
jgi:uncharacterized membrane protein YkoI